MNGAALPGPRLLVDCTCMLGGPHYTGIQRYLRCATPSPCGAPTAPAH